MVARQAGVSTATVSHVINKTHYVTDETRDKVLRAIQELNFRPNLVARNLRRQSSDVIGLIISDVTNAFFTSVIRGVEDVAHQNHYTVVLCNTDEDPEKERYYVEVMLQRQVVGLIMAPTTGNHEYLQDLMNRGLRVVLLDRKAAGLDAPAVVLDNQRAAYEATAHLIELGHRRIGVVAGLAGLTTTQGRVAGYRQALAAAGIPEDPELIVTGDSRLEGGGRAVSRLMEQPKRPTAVFVTNGLMTIGVMRALHEQGLNVPQDVALVGFDDFPWADAFHPRLTTVAQPTYELGAEAARLLLDPAAPADDVVLPPRLIVRESCGAGAAANNTEDVS